MGNRIFGLLFFSSVLNACGSAGSFHPDSTETPIPAESPSSSDARVSLKGTALKFDDESLKFTYVASVDAPLAPNSKNPLQATAFDFSNDRAFVVYNMAGSEIVGAVEMLNLDSWKSPRLIGGLLFKDAEFSDVKVKDNYAFAVGVESGEHEGAVLKVIRGSSDEKPVLVASLPLDGFVATSIQVQDGRAFVAVGDNAGIYEISIKDPENPEVLRVWKLPQAKFAIPFETEFLALGGDESTDLWAPFMRESLESIQSISKNIDEAPGRMAIHDDYLYTNAGQLGLHIYDLKHWEKKGVQELSSLELKGTGNGIDVCSNLAFLAQGEAGSAVYSVKNPKKPEALGYFDFPDDRGSANNIRHGKVKNENFLMIADGAGGFRIVHFVLP